MHDMFIQSQQFVTSSSGAVQHKKRKTENSISEHCLLQHSNNNNNHNSINNINNNTTATTISSSSATTATNAVNNSSQTELSHASPRNLQQQPFVRASTIKLLDTYQRCGQKVNISN